MESIPRQLSARARRHREDAPRGRSSSSVTQWMSGESTMSEPFLAEVKIVSFNFAPKGWAMCNGQLLPINQNQALFALLGTTYGGDGRVNFALPDLRGRIPIHFGNTHSLGERSGEENHN